MHPHGVLYAKDSEGAPYADGTSGRARHDDAVRPGAAHTYVWEVPERAGPAAHESSSIAWMYHGHVDVEDEGFVESNLMHAVNGYVYGNGPAFVMRTGERVRWYLMAMGTEVDLHTPHWHGNTVTAPMRTDVVSLLPASMATADMRPDARGRWLFHCHVGDHITAGMQARYEVR